VPPGALPLAASRTVANVEAPPSLKFLGLVDSTTYRMRCWRILAQQQPFTKTTPSPVALSHVYTAFDDTHFEIQLVRHLLFLNLHKECGTRRAKSNAAGRAIPGADAFRLAQLLSRRALVISEHAHQRDETEYADTNAFFVNFEHIGRETDRLLRLSVAAKRQLIDNGTRVFERHFVPSAIHNVFSPRPRKMTP